MDPRIPEELLTIDCLKKVVREICTTQTTTESWETHRDEFNASFERFMSSCTNMTETTKLKWTSGIQGTQKKFVEYMEIPEKTAEVIQEILETYMLLVNASFLVDTTQGSYEYMNGIEFPGLWSRVLYNDDTRTKKYRNMLVGCRPVQFKSPTTQHHGWTLMLINARWIINHLLQTHPNSLLSEYDTNLGYALNYWEHCMLLPEPPMVDARCMKSVEVWMVDSEGGEDDDLVEYDMVGINYILPAFLGMPCGVTVSKGFVFILTTDGEIFKLQISRPVVTDGVEKRELLIYDRTKCIVQHPNKCTIKRLNFEKGTAAFPALISRMPQDLFDSPSRGVEWHTNLSPTSLLVDPCGKLIVLSCAQSRIYEIHPVFGWIKEHLGRPAPRGWLADWKDIAPRELTDLEQDQTNCSFRCLMCGTFDDRGDLFVCDGNWIRKITYASKLEGNGSVVRDRTKFNVKNVINLHAECATSIAVGPTGLIVAKAVWEKHKYKTYLADIHIFEYKDHEGKSVRKRNVVDIKKQGDELLCSLLVDGMDNIVFGTDGRLEFLEKASWFYMDHPGSKIRTRGDKKSTHMLMHEFGMWTTSPFYLTWFGGSILACTRWKEKPMLSFLHGKPQTTNKRPLPEASEGERQASRPRTTAPGGPAGGTAALLQQLAQICI